VIENHVKQVFGGEVGLTCQPPKPIQSRTNSKKEKATKRRMSILERKFLLSLSLFLSPDLHLNSIKTAKLNISTFASNAF
jgi:hypothetical protein